MLEQHEDRGSEDQTRAQTPWRRFTPRPERLLSDGPAAYGSRRRICGTLDGFCHLDGNRAVDRERHWWLKARAESLHFPTVRVESRVMSRGSRGWAGLVERKPAMHINALCGEADVDVRGP